MVSLCSLDELTLKLDEELVMLAKTGDNVAFAELVRRYQGEVYRLLHAMTSDSEDALDCTQDVCMKAWKKIGSLQNPRCFPSWIRMIAKRRGYDYWREKKAFNVSWDNVKEDALIDYMYDPETLIIQNELVRKTLAELPVKYSLCLLLQLLGGLSHREIADVIGIRTSSVSTYMCDAKKRFAHIYQHLSNDDIYPFEEIDDA